MLVLTRRADAADHASIKVGDEIEVTVLEVRGGQIRLGVKAPRSVDVHRLEIWLERQAQQEMVEV